MKTVEELIKRVRRETRNATTGSTTAGKSIVDAEFIDQLQDAQELAVEHISNSFSTILERTKIYTIDTSATSPEELSLPDYLLWETKIALVEYSYSGRDRDYLPMQPVDIRERYSAIGATRGMMGYIQSGPKVILSEIPYQNGSKVRVVYELAPPRLDVAKATLLTGSRSGTDFSGTYSVSGATDTDLDGTTDISEWDVGDTVTVLDSTDNSVLIRDAEISAFNPSTGTFTFDLTNATYTATTVDAATATNLRLIEGGRTNLCELPDYFEKFIVAYAVDNILGRDGSKLAQWAMNRFMRIEMSLLKSLAFNSRDWLAIPEGNG